MPVYRGTKEEYMSGSKRERIGWAVGFAALGLVLAAGLFAQGSFAGAADRATSGASANYIAIGNTTSRPALGSGADSYTRKLPPPPCSVKPVAPDPNYRPLAC